MPRIAVPVGNRRSEQIIDRLEREQPGLLARLDKRKYALEAQEPLDDKVDAFIRAHRSSFFT